MQRLSLNFPGTELFQLELPWLCVHSLVPYRTLWAFHSLAHQFSQSLSLFPVSHFCDMANGANTIFYSFSKHSGPDQPRIQIRVLGHSLIRSLVRSYRSLVRLLRTARFARALHCAHSFARSLTSLAPSLVGKGMARRLFCLCFFFLFSTIVPQWQFTARNSA